MKKTLILDIINEETKQKNLEIAAKIIKEGGTVCFPTETVYGLGANALDESAVEKIYEAKGRPGDNPLICHVCDTSMFYSIAGKVNKNAKKLMEAFMPGPITIIVEKNNKVAKSVSKNINTVGIRMPLDENARELIRLSGVPIAAPSANLSGKPSCTSAKHVISDMSSRVDAILCGKDSEIGLESTVVDASADEVKILRYGKVTPEEIEKVIGTKVGGAKKEDFINVRSPGMKYTHYKPTGDVIMVEGTDENVVRYMNEILNSENDKKNAAVMAFDDIIEKIDSFNKYPVPRDMILASHELFSILRDFDKKGLCKLYAQTAPFRGVGLAYMDRLSHSSGYNKVNADVYYSKR